jgi:type IV pilus assembly protein PilX
VTPGFNSSSKHQGPQRRQRGVVLAITLVLVMVLTLLGTSGLVTSVLELRMAANAQYQARAFAAAEFAIEQAIHTPGLATSIGYTNPLMVPASGAAPAVPGSSPDTFTYRVYFDTVSNPASGGAAVEGLRAYHFVVEATGTSLRGASDSHVQGFYVLGPEAPPAALTPPACAPDCSDPSMYAPVRTFWLQRNVE